MRKRIEGTKQEGLTFQDRVRTQLAFVVGDLQVWKQTQSNRPATHRELGAIRVKLLLITNGKIATNGLTSLRAG